MTTYLTVVPVSALAVPTAMPGELEAARLDAERAAVRREFGSLDDCNLPLPQLTRVQARAERNLTAAIAAEYDDGVTVPCLTDPASWDADFAEGQVTREDVFRVAQLCRTACPVFAQCDAYRLTNPPVHGIVAGRYVKHESEIRTPRAGRPETNRRDDWATGRDVGTAASDTTTTADAA